MAAASEMDVFHLGDEELNIWRKARSCQTLRQERPDITTMSIFTLVSFDLKEAQQTDT